MSMRSLFVVGQNTPLFLRMYVKHLFIPLSWFFFYSFLSWLQVSGFGYLLRLFFCFIAFKLKAIADVEKAIIEALERQYADVLAPLKDSMAPKKFGLKYVQKLTKRNSVCPYTVPDEVCFYILVSQSLYHNSTLPLLNNFFPPLSAWYSSEYNEKVAWCIATQDRSTIQILGLLYARWWKYCCWGALGWSYSHIESQVQKLPSSSCGETCRECEYISTVLHHENLISTYILEIN